MSEALRAAGIRLADYLRQLMVDESVAHDRARVGLATHHIARLAADVRLAGYPSDALHPLLDGIEQGVQGLCAPLASHRELASQELDDCYMQLARWGFVAATQQGEGGMTAAGRAKGIPLAEAEILVRDWLAAHAKDNPAAVTRDAVAAGTGVSAGNVSKTAAWKAFSARRDAETKPGAREVPLTTAMRAVLPADCETPDELAALIEEQRADEDKHKRRHKRRHEPS